MKSVLKCLLLGTAVILAAGCTTVGTFKIPEGSQLYVANRPVQPDAAGQVTVVPFQWNSIGVPPDGGISYRLEKDGNVIKQGKLRSRLRVVSFFWPPLAIIYWPVGFNPNITYDLVNDTQQ